MGKRTNAANGGAASVRTVEERAAQVARDLQYELVEVTLQKESRGKCLCVYVDRDGGISLDDCEKYHRALQPLLEDIEYDIMEVSSPGIDRPVKTARDFEKNRDALVEVKLFAPWEGSKLYRGKLKSMDGKTVAIEAEGGKPLCFERKAVAIIRPVIQLDEDGLPLSDEAPVEVWDGMEEE